MNIDNKVIATIIMMALIVMAPFIIKATKGKPEPEIVSISAPGYAQYRSMSTGSDWYLDKPKPGKTVAGEIQAAAEKEWPGNYTMQAFEVRKQTEAWQKLEFAEAEGIPDNVFEQLKEDAKREWHGNYNMQVFHVKRQTDSYRKLHGGAE